MQNMLVMKDLVKKYAASYAVNHVNIELPKGEFLTLLGPSGSGKSTTLKMVAGLEIPTAGEIWIDGKEISDLPPNKRGLGMVFQNYALFPHMTIAENLAFPMKMRKTYTKGQIADKVRETLELIQLPDFGGRYPTQLSGGQQQRVALGRALIFQPPIILMDEPLGALDKKLRGDMQLEIKRIQKKMDITTIYVTHDQEEALTMSDRIAIMNHGKIEQMGTPREIYENPNNAFVADFIGESNFLPVEVLEDRDGKAVLAVKSEMHTKISLSHTLPVPTGEDLKLVVRPEKMLIAPSLFEQRKVDGKITDIIYLGEMVRYIVLVDGKYEIIAKQQILSTDRIFPVGTKVELGWKDENAQVL